MSMTPFLTLAVLCLALAPSSSLPQRQLGSQQKVDIGQFFTNRQLDVHLPSGFGVGNNPPDYYEIVDSLWRSNDAPEGLYKGSLKVSGASRSGAVISVSSFNPKFSGSFQVYYG